jgi:hypothetical protein
MTPLDFIASLTGEAKAAALTTYNLMEPKWIEITDDPATMPPLRVAVIIRLSNGLEGFGYLDEWTEEGESIWRKIITPVWDRYTQRVDSKGCKGCDEPVTHWRPI